MIIEKLEDFLVQRGSGVQEPKKSIWGSSIGQCTRQLTIDLYDTNLKVNKSPQVSLILESGKSFHKMMQALLLESGLVKSQDDLEVRVEVDDPTRVSGFIDAIATIGKNRVGIELKSTSEWSFKKGKLPYLTHKDQALLYMMLKKELRTFYLIYAPRDMGIRLTKKIGNLPLKEYKIKYNEQEAQRLWDKIELINQSVLMNRLPPIPQEATRVNKDGRYICKFCPYFNIKDPDNDFCTNAETILGLNK